MPQPYINIDAVHITGVMHTNDFADFICQINHNNNTE